MHSLNCLNFTSQTGTIAGIQPVLQSQGQVYGQKWCYKKSLNSGLFCTKYPFSDWHGSDLLPCRSLHIFSIGKPLYFFFWGRGLLAAAEHHHSTEKLPPPGAGQCCGNGEKFSVWYCVNHASQAKPWLNKAAASLPIYAKIFPLIFQTSYLN